MMNVFGNNVLMNALTAMKSGKSPEQYLKEMAGNSPELGAYDFSDLEGLARNLCEKKGINFEAAVNKIKGLM